MPAEVLLSANVLDASPFFEANVLLDADVTGGPGITAEVILTAITGVPVEAEAFVTADVLAPTILEPIPAGATSDGDALVDASDEGWGSDHVQASWGARSYSVQHSMGGGLSGAIESWYQNDFSIPPHVPTLPGAVSGYSIREAGEVVFQRSFQDTTRALLTDTTLSELMPVAELQALAAGGVRVTPFPLDATLCDGISMELQCIAESDGLIRAILPTRLHLARQAASAAGVAVNLIAGPGVVGAGERVPRDYTTQGKTPARVISELLLEANPRVWYEPGLMTIDARVLPTASLGLPSASPPTTPPSDDADDQVVDDFGLESVRLVRFTSSDRQGILLANEVRALVSLYESGASFALETDLMRPLGDPAVAYNARFEPDSTPRFTPATPDGSRYYFDIALLVEEVGS